MSHTEHERTQALLDMAYVDAYRAEQALRNNEPDKAREILEDLLHGTEALQQMSRVQRNEKLFRAWLTLDHPRPDFLTFAHTLRNP
jgi:hypothetical protein